MPALAQDFRIVEELRVFTPLGLRFWDLADDVQVREGLEVTAWPNPGLRPVARARRGGSDLYVFHGLPGLRRVEYPPLEGTTGDSPPAPRGFVVTVRDRRRRFVPVAFPVDLPLPYRGVFLATEASPVDDSPMGFLLFSAATRPRPPWTAAVRGELADAATRQELGHALVEVEINGEPTSFGLADEAGRFAVFLPYPAPVEALGLAPSGMTPSDPSPPTAAGTPLEERTFEVSLRVHRAAGALAPLPGGDLPSYAEILTQPPAEVWPIAQADGGVAEPRWTGNLRWGRELVARTAGDSKLLISPSQSPP